MATARYGVGQWPISGGPSSTGTVTLVTLVKLVTLVTFGGQKVPFVAFELLVPFVGGTGTHALTFALAAARALVDRDDIDTEAIARKAMEIAADICVYTNTQLIVEKL